MSEVEGLSNGFVGISISEARVDSKLSGGVTLCFCLTPTPVPTRWKVLFTQISGDKHGSLMSITNPLIHGNDVVWQVSEGDIPNARHFVEERVEHTNSLYEEMLAGEAQQRVVHHVEVTSQSEIDRLQSILDQA